MIEKLLVTVQHTDGIAHVTLGGVLDEDNELAHVTEQIGTNTAFIHLGEVQRINSCGTRDWVNWLASLEANGTQSVFVECSPAVVSQMNLVGNFTRNAIVKSFYVPYFCSRCNEEKILLVEAEDLGPPPHEPPTSRCDTCELVMTFDDMPDQYFAFLDQQRKSFKDLALTSEVARGSSSNVKTRRKSRPSIPELPVLTTKVGSQPHIRTSASRLRSNSIPPLPPVVIRDHGGSPVRRERRPLVVALALAVMAAIVALVYVACT